jgi:hypothetical protein
LQFQSPVFFGCCIRWQRPFPAAVGELIVRHHARHTTMNCTLDICGGKKIQNPTEADIRQEVFALDTETNDAFIILGPTDMTYIQTSGDQKIGFDLEYQETDIKHHYRAKRSIAAEEVVKALVSYSIASDDWKHMVEWELLEL